MRGIRTKTIARHLARLGFEPDSPRLASFLEPKLASLTDPSGMVGRALAAERLARAARQGERVVVFGDYDCDGMTSTALLTEGLRALGAREVIPLLASRFDGGYGLSGAALARVLDKKPNLVVTCDCGSSDHPSLAELGRAGVDVVVIDHHLVPSEPLPALAFLNPHRPECGFPYKGLASVGLALSVVAAVRAELSAELDVRRWLDLVAVGTIADVAPLDGDNRALVRAGLVELGRRRRPGLAALARLIGFEAEEQWTASDVAFRIAPRLNAPGRLGAPDVALELLLETDPDQAHALATEVERLCQARREEQKRIEEEARQDAEGFGDAAALVLGRPGWNHGIVGIVAGRLADEHKKPVVVLGFEGEVGRGSVRGPAGFPLFDALSAASSQLRRFGGHQAAAGLELGYEDLERFREDFVAACVERADFERPPSRSALDVDPDDALSDVLSDLRLLEPCGEKNPLPELALDAELRLARAVKGDHLKLELERMGGARVSGFGPGLGALAARFEPGRWVRAFGQVRPDRYRGGDAVELLVNRLEEAAR